MINPTYNLPRIKFVGGETKRLYFYMQTEPGVAADVAGCTVALAIRDFNNPEGESVFELNCNIKADSNETDSIVVADIPPQATVNLRGRYIYQITIKDSGGVVDIPGQGYMDIIKNIHPDFIA